MAPKKRSQGTWLAHNVPCVPRAILMRRKTREKKSSACTRVIRVPGRSAVGAARK